MTEQNDFKELIENIDDKSKWEENVSRHCILRSNLEFSGDAILFVGSTKSGKSTLINCLLGNTLKCVFDEASEDWNLENVNDRNSPISRQPKIAALGPSETLWPMSYKSRNITLWDMPGLNDNRGVQHEIKEAAMSRIVITNHRAVSLVLVVPKSLVNQPNQLPFVELINTFSQYSDNIEEHSFIVISKTSSNNWQGLLRRVLDWNPTEDNTNAPIIERAKEIVRAVVARNAGYSFKMPHYEDENEHMYRFPDVDLIDTLNNIEKVNLRTCPYVFGIASKLYLTTQQQIFNNVIKTNFEKICDFYENDTKSRVQTIVQHQVGKDDRIDRIICARKNLINSNELNTFLDFVLHNTSAPRDQYFFSLISDIRSDQLISLKCMEMLASNDSPNFADLIQSTMRRVGGEMDAAQMKISQEDQAPSSGYFCNIL